MLRQEKDCIRSIKENFKGADGSCEFVEFSKKEEMFNHNRLFSKIILNPHSGIGYHGHQGETEIFYILQGEALYQDDDEKYVVHAGDVVQCLNGHSHGINNLTDEKVELIALIVLE